MAFATSGGGKRDNPSHDARTYCSDSGTHEALGKGGGTCGTSSLALAFWCLRFWFFRWALVRPAAPLIAAGVDDMSAFIPGTQVVDGIRGENGGGVLMD